MDNHELSDFANKGNDNNSEWNILIETEEEPRAEVLPTPEQKQNALQFDKLSKISTDEYLEVWKHLNPFYVTHVTRQGIRDHSGMIYHTAGLGAFQNGLVSMLKDNKTLRTKSGANYGIMPNFTEEDVEKALDILVDDDLYKEMTPEQILANIPFNATFASSEAWPDQTAVHFGQLTVLDDFYGGEAGNETFVVYPTDVIISQCKFGGHIHSTLTHAQTTRERKWNDLFVWPEDGKIPLDAGLVFLPNSQKVDRNTGSKYATEPCISETGETLLVPVKDEERISRFKEWLSGLTMESPEIAEIQNGDFNSTSLRKKLAEIGIPDECIDEMALFSNHYSFIRYISSKTFDNLPSQEQREQMTPEEISDYSIRRYLASHNADLKLAEDTIPASEYWEHYFATHPDERPTHVIYYDGDPSHAVENLLKAHGIAKEKNYFGEEVFDDMQRITGPGDTHERDGGRLGFGHHYVGREKDDEQMSSEHRRFNEIAIRILREKQATKNG